MNKQHTIRARRWLRLAGAFALAFAAFLSALSQTANAADDQAQKKTDQSTTSRHVRIQQKRQMINQLARQERERIQQEKAKREKAQMQKKLKEARGEAGKPAERPSESGAKESKPAAVTAVTAGPGRTTAPSYVLLLSPLNQSVLVGNRFMTTVRFQSDQAQPIDQLDISLSYPPLEVKPLRVFDYPLADYLKSDAPSSITMERGILRYRADLKFPLATLGETDLIHIVWEAIGESDNSALILGHSDRAKGRGSAVYYNGYDLLRSPWLVGQSCINATVVSTPPADQVRGLRILGDGARHAGMENVSDERRSKSDGIALELLPPAKSPQIGDEFVVDVLVSNPEHMAFNEVRLAIEYNPRALEVLDWDFMGWIKRGTNLFDAHAHTRFPFNIHNRNEVNSYRGRITYHMGTTFLRPMPSGSLCRIRCRAVGPGAVESLTLFPQDATDDWYTEVRAGAESVLKRPAPTSSVAARDAYPTR